MTDQERLDNERIAEFLNATVVHEVFRGGIKEGELHRLPDFHADESANAILRDALVKAGCKIVLSDFFSVYFDVPSNVDLSREEYEDWQGPAYKELLNWDYKRAIVGAFLLFMATTKPEVQG